MNWPNSIRGRPGYNPKSTARSTIMYGPAAMHWVSGSRGSRSPRGGRLPRPFMRNCADWSRLIPLLNLLCPGKLSNLITIPKNDLLHLSKGPLRSVWLNRTRKSTKLSALRCFWKKYPVAFHAVCASVASIVSCTATPADSRGWNRLRRGPISHSAGNTAWAAVNASISVLPVTSRARMP